MTEEVIGGVDGGELMACYCEEEEECCNWNELEVNHNLWLCMCLVFETNYDDRVQVNGIE